MKSTGVVRKTDELGRIVLPMELRKTIGIDPRDPLEIFIDGDSIILRPYRRDTEKAEMISKLKSVVVDNPTVKDFLDEVSEFLQKKA